MKLIFLLAGTLSLLFNTGCIVADGGRRGHARYEHHDEVIVGPPPIEVRAPVVEVRPPEIIVR